MLSLFVVLFFHNLIELLPFISVSVSSVGIIVILPYCIPAITFVIVVLAMARHTLNASARTHLYWDGSTCAQTGLKCISCRQTLTLLP